MPAGGHLHTRSRPFLDELLHDLIDHRLVTFKSKGFTFFPRKDIDVRAMPLIELNTAPGVTSGVLFVASAEVKYLASDDRHIDRCA